MTPQDYARLLQPHTSVIFLFHGVIREHRHRVRNYTRKHLSVSEFSAVLEALAEAGTPVKMQDLVEAAQEGTPLPCRAFAITFDDGFANNFSTAAPVLRSKGIPAMFYVTTRFVDANAMSWIDRIESAVDAAEVVRCRLPGETEERTASGPESKIALLDAIRRVVKQDARADPIQFAEEFCAEIGVQGGPDPDLDAKMTWAQVRTLGAEELFAIGGHSHTHRVLEYLDDRQLESEVRTSIGLLQRELSRVVTHYSYPEGLSYCYSERVIRVLKRHGIVCAPTAEPGVNLPSDDLFRLKRVTVASVALGHDDETPRGV